MYAVLQQYLELHRQLIIPGIGTFSIQRSPAEFDHASRTILPASYSILLHHDNSKPAASFFKWLAGNMQLPLDEIENRFNLFVQHVRKEVLSGQRITWENIGTLSKGMGGEIRFESSLKHYTNSKPIAAKKIIRENADHLIRVGEDEKTSTEMIEMLQPVKAKQSFRWLAAAILAFIAVAFLVIYIVRNGFHSGNAHSVDASTANSTYQVVQ